MQQQRVWVCACERLVPRVNLLGEQPALFLPQPPARFSSNPVNNHENTKTQKGRSGFLPRILQNASAKLLGKAKIGKTHIECFKRHNLKM